SHLGPTTSPIVPLPKVEAPSGRMAGRGLLVRIAGGGRGGCTPCPPPTRGPASLTRSCPGRLAIAVGLICGPAARRASGFHRECWSTRRQPGPLPPDLSRTPVRAG